MELGKDEFEREDIGPNSVDMRPTLRLIAPESSWRWATYRIEPTSPSSSGRALAQAREEFEGSEPQETDAQGHSEVVTPRRAIHDPDLSGWGSRASGYELSSGLLHSAAMTRPATLSQRVQLEPTTDRKYIPSLVALENRCFRSYYRPHRFDAQDFQYYFDNSQTIHVLAVAGSAAVGYILGIVGTGERRHLARIYSVAVDRAFRSQGIGTRLTKAFIRHAGRRSCRIIHTEVAAQNIPSQHLFEQLGFRAYRRLPHYYGRGVHGLRLRLVLEE